MTRFNENGNPLCARPTCDRAAWGRGYCETCARTLGIIHKRIPAIHAKRIITQYQQQGASLRDINESTGVSLVTLTKIVNGKSQTTLVTTPNQLKENPPAPKRPLAFAARRKARALRAIGFTVAEIANGVGVSISTVRDLCSEVNPVERIHRDVDDAIGVFYDVHCLDEARAEHPLVARHRWPAPLDWDDIDDPDEVAIASRFFPSAGECVRGHELYEFNTFKSSADSIKPKCKSCVSAMNALLKWKPNHSVEDVQWLSDTLFETYRRGDIAYPKALIDGGLSDDQAA